jgi:hypothetical protein
MKRTVVWWKDTDGTAACEGNTLLRIAGPFLQATAILSIVYIPLYYAMRSNWNYCVIFSLQLCNIALCNCLCKYSTCNINLTMIFFDLCSWSTCLCSETQAALSSLLCNILVLWFLSSYKFLSPQILYIPQWYSCLNSKHICYLRISFIFIIEF